MSKRTSLRQIIKQVWHVIVLTSLAGTLLGVGASFLRPLEYRATLDLEVRQNIGDADAFTLVEQRSAFSNELAKQLASAETFNLVVHQTDGVDESYFNEEKDWARGVSVHHSLYKGRYLIQVYHTNAEQAVLIVNAIASTLIGNISVEEYGDFHLRAVGEPTISRWPIRPNLFVNGAAGLVLGLTAGIGYSFLHSDRQKRRHALIHEDV